MNSHSLDGFQSMSRYYRSNRPKNPYYHPNEKKKRPWGRIGLLGAIGVVVAFAILMFSSAFSITEIRVEGASQDTAAQIRVAVEEGITSHSRLLTFRTKNIWQRLEEEFALESLHIEKDYFHTLVVQVEERTPHAVWQTATKAWLIDQTGREVGEIGLNDPRRAELTYFFDESGTQPEADVFVSAARLDQALLLQEILKDDFSLEILLIKLASPVDSFAKYVTGEGWELYIDLAEDADTQLEKLETVLLDLGDARTTLRYIDTRFSDRVYYQ
jgi:hypothetical protein